MKGRFVGGILDFSSVNVNVRKVPTRQDAVMVGMKWRKWPWLNS
jgi:hypothetical protein